jgi:drug/metabolite transporter (DMT)-like permease
MYSALPRRLFPVVPALAFTLKAKLPLLLAEPASWTQPPPLTWRSEVMVITWSAAASPFPVQYALSASKMTPTSYGSSDGLTADSTASATPLAFTGTLVTVAIGVWPFSVRSRKRTRTFAVAAFAGALGARVKTARTGTDTVVWFVSTYVEPV